jgi:plastocyanin
LRPAALTLAAAALMAATVTACGAAAPLPTAPPGAVVITAQGNAFAPAQVAAPAGEQITLFLENRDNEPHNVRVWDAAGSSVYAGELVQGRTAKVESVPALPAGTYHFTCDIHPEMTGQLEVQ